MRPALLLTGLLGLALACGSEPGTRAQTAPVPTPSPDHSALIAAIDALAAEALARGPIAGLSVAVARGGQTLLARGYGYADQEVGIPAAAETSYPVASITKQFTAAAILQLAERGRLGVDDPLSVFFPDARAAIGRLTVRQLLNHTSGLTRGGPAPRTAALSVLKRGGTAWPAGKYWDYSNYNFSLLGLVVEQASGRSYAEYVRQELAAPLGLTGTGYCEDGTPVPGRTRDYESGRRRAQPTPYWTQPRFFAAGGLCSSVLDLLRWQRALDEGRVVGAASLQGMRAPTPMTDGLAVGYGYGTRLGAGEGHRKLGHTGGGRSNKAVLAHYPDDQATIVVLFNTERTGADVLATDLEARIARVLFGLADPAPTGVSLPAGELERYTGQYRDGPVLVRVVAADGTLKLRAAGGRGQASPLVAQGGDVFADAEEPSVQLRFVVSGDKARGYERYHNGWFVGLGVRTGDLPPSAGRPARRPARPDRDGKAAP